jgi:hypothetical protein
MKSQIFLKHITFADTHKNRGIHPYEYVHTQPTHMSIFERFNRFDLKIESHHEHLNVDTDGSVPNLNFELCWIGSTAMS